MTSGCILLVTLSLFGATDALTAQAEAPLRTLKPEFRLSAEEHNLSAIGSVAVGPDGILAINQGQDRQVRLFSAKGQPLATIGRRGSGPGEFQSPRRLFWRADTLWVGDGTLNRLSAFDRSGRFLLATPLPAAFGPQMVAPDGRRFVQPQFVTRNPDGTITLVAHLLGGERGKSRPWLIAIGADGALKRVGTELPGDDCIRQVGGTTEVVIPYCPRALNGDSPQLGSTVSAVTHMNGSRPARFQVTTRRATGETSFSREYLVPVNRITPAEVTELRADDPKHPRPPAVLEFIRRSPIPEARPPFVGVNVAPDGSAWFIRPNAIDGNYEYFGVDPTGTPIGRIRVHTDAALVWASRDVAWVIERDADGLETLVRYRIVK
jgi:hypothetical protein